MLRKSKIAAAMLMATATAGVNAAHVNTDGTGQVALLPYYNVNNNFITNVNITNTTGEYKAVKLRFRESRISADVLDFNVYMSPFDVWNATIRLNGSVANIITEDETCTYPAKAALQAGVDFRNIYTATTDEDLTEGYVEIIEMGVVADGAGIAVDGGDEAEIDASGTADGAINAVAGDRSIPAGLLHDATGMPADCSVVSDAWTAGAAGAPVNGFEPGAMTTEGVAQDAGGPAAPYADTMNAGLVEPTGGINAYSIMINTATGAAFVEQGTHIDDYSTVAQHYQSDDASNYLLPSLASGDVQVANMLDNTGAGVKTIVAPLVEYDTGSINDIAPNPSIPMGSNPLPLALILSADAVSAPYFVEAGINGETDIVMTFPLRKHGIYNSGTLTNDLDGAAGPLVACVGTLNDGVDDGATVALPTLGTPANDYPNDGAGAICENAGYAANAEPDVEVGLTYYDYEEQTATVVPGADDFSPVPIDAPTIVALEREVNVVSVNRAAGGNQSVLGTPAANVFNWNLDSGFEAGWVTISAAAEYDYETNPSIIALTEPVGGIGAAAGVWTGVPVIGFSAMAGDVGPAQLGETVDLIRSVNRTP
ncbi:MAG: hypothetical protein N0E58_17695 [Candidatus Thiodiazotropha endolucinida]|uniref:Uncharacterized protein n=1 Tax=Candidatus Thiodiazotropha taylori TaxID=2792791 RepID=A0A9E4NME3_9GAMM|nr:hypothetical protein [Candidatus Thiodiazotropha taylori]MBT3037466.1 hypothetical protein [Candidatus Thiodiazotropha sp. (ex Codakia orbicularis)]MCG7862869.1 hypothetical protein [Candidatus Thiodiazotropha endolucinida]MBT3041734.1 hypothetical protein [Candidatus Thiodiazotropha sp. (ex Codakia orbicularis)]MBT3053509.1 hypothetical protein [Candidatus Thiodiazotropha sp. (ex Codakia orbicularis)]